MRIVAALGGNALLERGETPDSAIQEAHIVKAAEALAPLAKAHDLVITHGNGPHVGLLALESAGDPALSCPYPFDVLGAQTQGMIGYWLMQALQNALPDRQVACLVSRTLVRVDDPAFARPTKFVGPVYDEDEARGLARMHGWTVRQDGARWRRVVPSPEPAELIDLPSVRLLVGRGAVVVCAGGGGVPVVRDAGGLRGIEAVVDKDLTVTVLAQALCADALLLLTDVDAVQEGFGTAQARSIRSATPGELRMRSFPAGSMGPKIEAVCQFVEATGQMAAIGRLADAQALLGRTAGTIVTMERRLPLGTGAAQDIAAGGQVASGSLPAVGPTGPGPTALPEPPEGGDREGYEADRRTIPEAVLAAGLSAARGNRRTVVDGDARAVNAQHPAVAVPGLARQSDDRAVCGPVANAEVQRPTRARRAYRVRGCPVEPAPGGCGGGA